MATTGNSDKEQRAEKIETGASKMAIAPGSVSEENYCPPRKPANENDSNAMEEYLDKLKSCCNHLLREVRVEIQEVVRILDAHVGGDLDIKAHLHELDSSKIDIEDRINDLKENYLRHLKPVDSYSEILNLWQMVEGSPYFYKEKRNELLDQNRPEQDRLREIKILKDRLARLIFMIEYITGKERINSWIEVARPGYVLPFHGIFEDEIKSPEHRQKILNLYSLSPKHIRGGLIDPVKGVIWCYPQGTLDQLLRLAIIFLFLLLSFLVIYQIGSFLSESTTIGEEILEIKQTDNNFLLMCWTAMLIGIVGHVLVTDAKASNVEYRQFPMPLRDWGYYLSARTTMILYKITLFIFVFLVTFVMLKGQINLMEAFLMGYSFDSVVELLGVSLEKRSAGNINVIKEKLGATG